MEQAATSEPSLVDMQQPAGLSYFIGALRIAAPLLHRKILEEQGEGAVALEGGRLSISRDNQTLLISLEAPSWADETQSRRLAILAAACVDPRPGWCLLWPAGRDAADSVEVMRLLERGQDA